MTKAAAKQHHSPAANAHAPEPSSRKNRLPSYLVTLDDGIWPQIGVHLTEKLNHRQIDGIDELLSTASPGEAAVILWDARGSAEWSAVLARLHAHSPSFAIVALDVADNAPAWAAEVERGQVMAHVGLPIEPQGLASALGSACEEASARMALLGHGSSGARGGIEALRRAQIAVAEEASAGQGDIDARDGDRILAAASDRGTAGRGAGMAIAGVAAVAILCAVAYLLLRRPEAPMSPVTAPGAAAAKRPSAADSSAAGATEDKVDALIGEAEHAMRDRHFIEPAEGSALSLYRSALALDPSSGEARQGLKRLAEILVAHVQTALDQKQFEAALQALETVRSIDPGDTRLPALDERVAKMRDELGPAEIQAAINAQNFDRADQLLDQAVRNKTVSDQKLGQLREDLRRHRAESDAARVVGLIDARLQQDQLIDPANDSAAYYIAQARKAGASAADVQSRARELARRLMQQAHAAIDDRRLSDADHMAGALRGLGTPPAAVAALQRDIDAARAAQQVHQQSDQSRLADLVKSRLAQGSVTDPANDSALYYLGQLRSVDPQNAALPGLVKAVQGQILDRASAALDGGELTEAESMLQLASSLGSSSDADALAQRLRLAKTEPSAQPSEVPEASLTRIRKLDVEYPETALEKKIEGTVELGYTVTAKGAVADVKVLDSNPSGVFENAASRAVSRLHYKPPLEGGKPTAVHTKLLVIFRLAA